jgi:hypothetical protein
MALATLVNAALAALLAGILFVALRPAAALDEPGSSSPFAEFFEDSYSRAAFLGIPLLVAATIACTIGLGMLLGLVHGLLLDAPDNPYWTILPSTAFFWASAPLGFALAVHLAFAAFRGVFDFLYPDFLHTQDERIDYDLKKLVSHMYLVLAAVSVVAVLFVSDWYTVFGPDEIVINELGSFEETRYTWDDVSELHYADMLWGAGWEYRDVYRVRFEDGYDLLLDAEDDDALDTETRQRILEVASAKTGLEVRELAFIPE